MLFLDEGDYSYQYYQGKKQLDIRKGNWSILEKDREIYNFFFDYLPDRLVKFDNVKNKNGKYAYPYGIESLEKSKLKEIHENTNLDYLIVYGTEKRLLKKRSYTDENIIQVTVYNINTQEIFYQIKGKVLIDNNGNKLLKPKLKRRILKKIQKHLKL